MVAAKKRQTSQSEKMTATRRMNVLLEDINGKIKALGEGIDARFSSFERRLDERFDALEFRISALEVAVKHLTVRVEGLEEDVRRLDSELRALKALLVSNAERSDYAALEARVRRVEEQLGLAPRT